MKIDRSNYEIYIVDYFDGKLDQATAQELLRFIGSASDLKESFDAYRSMILPVDETIIYNDKSSLKKAAVRETENISEANRETYFIGHTEKILSEAEEAELMQFIALNPQFQKELSIYLSTKLSPDLSIEFPAKEALKKTVVIRSLSKRLVISLSAAAALFVIFISVFLLSRLNHDVNDGNGIATLFQNNKLIRSVVNKGTAPAADTYHNNTEVKTNTAQQNDQIPVRENFNPFTCSGKKELAQIETPADKAIAVTEPSVRSEFTDIYNYQKVLADSKRNIEKEQTAYQKLALFGLNKIRKAGGQKQPAAEPDTFSLWDLAYLGVAGYNKITNSNLSIDRKTDNNGKLSSFALVKGNDSKPEK